MNTETENQTTSRDIIFILFKHKLIILICFFSVVISVTLITGQKKQEYEASTSLLVKLGRENFFRDSTLSGTSSVIDYSSKVERMNTEMTILRSYDLRKAVIQDIGIENIYPWLQLKKSSDNNTTPSIPPIETAIAIFNANLSLKAAEKSNILNISFTHFNPVTAANAANTLVDHFLVQHLRIYQQPEQLIFFEAQVEKYKEILNKSENDLKIFKNNNNISVITSQKGDLLSKISEFKSRIAETSINIAELEARLILLNEKEASGETSQINLDAITSIRSKVTTLKLEEQALVNRYNPSNMKIVNIRAEIEAGEKLIDSEEMVYFQKEKISVQNELDAVNSKLSAEKLYLNIFQNELNTLDRIELELKDLERKVNLDEESYELYAARTEESRISNEMDAQKIANISVVDKASPPLRPLPTNRALSVLISILMGLFLGIAVALIIEFNSHSFNNREDIINKLQIKALASIPELKKKGFKFN